MVRVLMGRVNRPANASTALLASSALSSGGTLPYLATTRSGVGATYVDAAGITRTIAANTTRINNGTIIGTNLIRNPRFEGGASGQPGAQPTNHGYSNLAGTTRTLTYGVTSDGMEYVEARFTGSPTSSGTFIFAFEPIGQIPNVQGQNTTFSVYVSINGTYTLSSSTAFPRFIMPEYDSSNTFTGSQNTSNQSLAALTTLTRTSFTYAPISATCATVRPTIQMTVVLGTPVDFTIRLARPQLEYGTTMGALSVPPIGSPEQSTVRSPSRLFVEEGRTNLIRNPRAEGATAGIIGSGGALPTFWTQPGVAASTTTVVGSGTEFGMGYVDIKFDGSGAGNAGLYFEASGAVAYSAATAYTGSVYARLIAGDMTNVTTFGIRPRYDTVTASNGVEYTSMLGLTNLLTRYTVSYTTLADTATGRFALVYAQSGVSSTTIRLYGPQVELGSFATSLILPAVGVPATTNRGNETTNIATTGLLKYTTSVTNQLLQSVDFSIAPWMAGAGGAATVTAGAGVAPDGTSTAALIDDTSGIAIQGTQQSQTQVGGQLITGSVYLKAGTSSIASVRLSSGGGTPAICEAVIDLSNGNVQWRGGTAGLSFSSVSVGSGWYRLSQTHQSNAVNTSINLEIRPAFAASFSPIVEVAATGNVLAWGPQVEYGGVANTYVPTTATTATKTKLAAGTLVARSRIVAVPTGVWGIFTLSDGTSANRMGLRYFSGGIAVVDASASISYTVTSPLGIPPVAATPYTAAMSWDDAGISASVNGGAATSGSVAIPLGITSISLGQGTPGNFYMNGEIDFVTYYPYKMTPAQLVSVTT